MEVKVDELAKLADAVRTERATLAVRRASLEVSATRPALLSADAA